MARDDARPEAGSLRTVRDVGLLLFVAAALIAGLVHYGVLVGEDHDDGQGQDPAGAVLTSSAPPPSPGPPAGAGSPSWTASATPSTWTSTPPATTPGSPAPTTVAESGSPSWTPDTAAATCWTGRRVTRLSECRLPSGVAGLTWVFPSLDSDRSACHVAPPTADYRTVVARECYISVDGTPVAITYAQVESTAQARRVITQSFADGQRHPFPGAHGGRCTWFDPTGRPARVTAVYGGFPYVVSLYAPDGATAKRAWATLVDMRPPGSVRGLSGA